MTNASWSILWNDETTIKLREWLTRTPIEQTQKGNRFLDLIEKDYNMPMTGANEYHLPVTFTGASQGSWYDNGDVTSVAGTSDTTMNKYPQAAFVEPVRVWRREIRRTMAPEAAVELVAHRLAQGRLKARNAVAEAMMGATSVSKQIIGLQTIITEDPATSGALGQIDGATESGWQNQIVDISANLTASWDKIDQLIADCQKYGLAQPTHIVSSQALKLSAINSSRSAASMNLSPEPARGRTADIGFNDVTYQGLPWIDDRFLTVDGNTEHSLFVLSTDALTHAVDEDFIMDGPYPLQANGQHGMVWYIYYSGQLCAKERSALGIAFDITAA